MSTLNNNVQSSQTRRIMTANTHDSYVYGQSPTRNTYVPPNPTYQYQPQIQKQKVSTSYQQSSNLQNEKPKKQQNQSTCKKLTGVVCFPAFYLLLIVLGFVVGTFFIIVGKDQANRIAFTQVTNATQVQSKMSNASQSILNDTILGIFTHQNNDNQLRSHKLLAYSHNKQKVSHQDSSSTDEDRHQINSHQNNNMNKFSNKLHTYTQIFRHRLESIKL